MDMLCPACGAVRPGCACQCLLGLISTGDARLVDFAPRQGPLRSLRASATPLASLQQYLWLMTDFLAATLRSTLGPHLAARAPAPPAMPVRGSASRIRVRFGPGLEAHWTPDDVRSIPQGLAFAEVLASLSGCAGDLSPAGPPGVGVITHSLSLILGINGALCRFAASGAGDAHQHLRHALALAEELMPFARLQARWPQESPADFMATIESGLAAALVAWRCRILLSNAASPGLDDVDDLFDTMAELCGMASAGLFGQPDGQGAPSLTPSPGEAPMAVDVNRASGRQPGPSDPVACQAEHSDDREAGVAAVLRLFHQLHVGIRAAGQPGDPGFLLFRARILPLLGWVLFAAQHGRLVAVVSGGSTGPDGPLIRALRILSGHPGASRPPAPGLVRYCRHSPLASGGVLAPIIGFPTAGFFNMAFNDLLGFLLAGTTGRPTATAHSLLRSFLEHSFPLQASRVHRPGILYWCAVYVALVGMDSESGTPAGIPAFEQAVARRLGIFKPTRSAEAFLLAIIHFNLARIELNAGDRDESERRYLLLLDLAQKWDLRLPPSMVNGMWGLFSASQPSASSPQFPCPKPSPLFGVDFFPVEWGAPSPGASQLVRLAGVAADPGEDLLAAAGHQALEAGESLEAMHLFDRALVRLRRRLGLRFDFGRSAPGEWLRSWVTLVPSHGAVLPSLAHLLPEVVWSVPPSSSMREGDSRRQVSQLELHRMHALVKMYAAAAPGGDMGARLKLALVQSAARALAAMWPWVAHLRDPAADGAGIPADQAPELLQHAATLDAVTHFARVAEDFLGNLALATSVLELGFSYFSGAVFSGQAEVLAQLHGSSGRPCGRPRTSAPAHDPPIGRPLPPWPLGANRSSVSFLLAFFLGQIQRQRPVLPPSWRWWREPLQNGLQHLPEQARREAMPVFEYLGRHFDPGASDSNPQRDSS